MGSTKLSVRTTDLDVAQAIEAALAAADPALDAVTLFEDGPGAWRVEAYSQVRADAESAAAMVAAEVAKAPPLQLEDVPDLNWVVISQAALPPVIGPPTPSLICADASSAIARPRPQARASASHCLMGRYLFGWI